MPLAARSQPTWECFCQHQFSLNSFQIIPSVSLFVVFKSHASPLSAWKKHLQNSYSMFVCTLVQISWLVSVTHCLQFITQLKYTVGHPLQMHNTIQVAPKGSAFMHCTSIWNSTVVVVALQWVAWFGNHFFGVPFEQTSCFVGATRNPD